MQNSIYKKPSTFIDFNSLDSAKNIDKLLMEAEKSSVLSFDEFVKKTSSYIDNIGKNV